MTTLYRKYRPQSFSDVADQTHIIKTLMNEVAQGTLAHAYLFSGPRGVGKTTTARLLAKAVNCEQRKEHVAEPCNTCQSCLEINTGRHIDVIEIDAASHTGVDNVRENVIENAQFKPTKARYKIFIIDEVHMLSTSAFNALLKTLEEPPAHVIFILATTELHKLPATVISRCQRFTFKKISYDRMLERLKTICKEEKVTVEQDVLERVITKSEGGLRDAESLLGQILSLNLPTITTNDVQALLPTAQHEKIAALLTNACSQTTNEALAIIKSTVEEGLHADHILLEIIDMLRSLLLAKSAQVPLAPLYGEKIAGELAKLLEKMSAEQCISLIELAIKRRLDIRSSPIPTLPLELFTIEVGLIMSGQRTAMPAAPTTPAPSAAAKPIPSAKPAVPPSTPKTTPPPELPPIAAKATEPSPTPLAAGNTISLDTVRKRWDEIVLKIDEVAHSLTFILKMCALQNTDNGTLTIGVQYSLHKEKLMEAKNKKVVEQALADILGAKLLLNCEVVTAHTSTPSTPNDISDLAAAFGGEVVA